MHQSHLKSVFASILKISNLLLTIMLLTIMLPGCSHVSYLAQNTWQHLSLFTSQKEIVQVLQEGNISPETKRSLELVLKVRQMAFKDLGFKESKNYSTFVQTPEAYVTYAVEAAPEFSLNPLTWYFPFIGTVPYLGYYRKQNAVNKFEDLKNQGYDVSIRGISAFSTLGWFTDPVFSSMLGDNTYLIQTIFHELTHAAVYFKSYSEFNENLASFVGKQCSLVFVAKEFGENSSEFNKLKYSENDFDLILRQIQLTIPSLEAVYQNNLLGDKEKRDSKNKILEDLAQKIKDLEPQIHPENKNFIPGFSKKMNNANLMNYRLYFGKNKQFETMLAHFGGNITKFLSFWSQVNEKEDPQKVLENYKF